MAVTQTAIARRAASAWKLRAGFILVPFVHSAGMNIVTLLAFRFLTDNLAISAAAAGAIFALVKVYDGFLDPALGALSDRTRSPWGRRLPFVFAGGLLMPLAIAMVFNTPDFSSVILAQIFLTVALMLHASAYTALTIPGLAMLVEATDDYHERTGLMAFRVVGNSMGVVLGSTFPAWLLSYWGATREGHSRMSLVVAGLVLVAGMAAVWCLRNAPATVPQAESGKAKAYNLLDQLALAWANMPFRILAITHIFVLFGASITSIGSSYFSKYVLRVGDGWLGTYYMIATAGSLAAMPFWVWASRRLGKKTAYMLAMAAFGALHLAWITARAGEPYPLLATRAVLIGAASAGVILCAYSMMSDAVRYDFIVSGLRREGAFSGFTSLIDKLSAAASIAIMGGFLTQMGYVASRAGAAATQPDSAIQAIYICLAIAPALAMLGGILVVSRYSLDESRLLEADASADA